MKLIRSTPIAPGPLVLTALINVVLLLMFFFLLGSSFVLQPGIDVSLPTSTFNLPPQVNAQLITMQPGPPARIFYRDQPVTIGQLEQELDKFNGSPRSVIVRADKGTPFELVVTVATLAIGKHYDVALATAPPPAETP